MGRFQILIYLCLCFFLCGCYNYFLHSDGGYRPKKSKFYLQDNSYKLKANDELKTNVIYFSNDTLKYGNGLYNSLSYYRFFENGRFYTSSIDIKNIKNIKKINKPLFVGYFNLNKGSEINMEYFFVKYRERGWYIKDQGYIKNDTLFIKGNDENGNYKESIYVPKKIEGLNSTPNW